MQSCIHIGTCTDGHKYMQMLLRAGTFMFVYSLDLNMSTWTHMHIHVYKYTRTHARAHTNAPSHASVLSDITKPLDTLVNA
jgi:hypothetical protein